jgi:hypothetical protein
MFRILWLTYYDVPAQKASAEVPFSECAISGSTVTRTVASKATTNEMKLRLTTTSISFLVGVHSVVTVVWALASISESILDPLLEPILDPVLEPIDSCDDTGLLL